MDQGQEKGGTTDRLAADTKTIRQLLEKRRQAAFTRFPLLFTLLGAFGLVATFYGFEHLIDSIPLLTENPIILLFTGIGTLILTGTLYRKLG